MLNADDDEGDQLHLSVWNSGNPVPENFRISQQQGLGLQLVRARVLDRQGFLALVPRGVARRSA